MQLMDQPRVTPRWAATRSGIGRDELKAKLDRGGDFKLIMALNRWAFDAKHIPGSVHFDTPDELYAAVRPDDRSRCLLLERRLPVERRRVPRPRPPLAAGTCGATRVDSSTGRTRPAARRGVRAAVTTPAEPGSRAIGHPFGAEIDREREG